MSKQIIEVNDIKQELLNLANILKELRYHTKYWELNFGSRPKENKKYWEDKADTWLRDHIKIEE